MNFEAFFNALLEAALSVGLRIVYAGLVFFIGLKLIKWLLKKLPTLTVMKKLDAGVRAFLSSVSATVLYVLLAVTLAMVLGVPTASFIAALASGLAAIGLAMQGSLSNFAGGLMLLIFKPFRTEDYISIPELNVEGKVMMITVVYTVLNTFDGIEVTIPNGTLMNSVVKNLTITDSRRIDLSFRVDPRHPVEEVQALLHQTAAAHPLVQADPAPFAPVTEVNGDALTYSLRVWCPNGEYWAVRFALIKAIRETFEANGIVVPRSQLDVHVEGDGEQKR